MTDYSRSEQLMTEHGKRCEQLLDALLETLRDSGLQLVRGDGSSMFRISQERDAVCVYLTPERLHAMLYVEHQDFNDPQRMLVRVKALVADARITLANAMRAAADKMDPPNNKDGR